MFKIPDFSLVPPVCKQAGLDLVSAWRDFDPRTFVSGNLRHFDTTVLCAAHYAGATLTRFTLKRQRSCAFFHRGSHFRLGSTGFRKRKIWHGNLQWNAIATNSDRCDRAVAQEKVRIPGWRSTGRVLGQYRKGNQMNTNKRLNDTGLCVAICRFSQVVFVIWNNLCLPANPKRRRRKH